MKDGLIYGKCDVQGGYDKDIVVKGELDDVDTKSLALESSAETSDHSVNILDVNNGSGTIYQCFNVYDDVDVYSMCTIAVSAADFGCPKRGDSVLSGALQSEHVGSQDRMKTAWDEGSGEVGSAVAASQAIIREVLDAVCTGLLQREEETDVEPSAMPIGEVHGLDPGAIASQVYCPDMPDSLEQEGRQMSSRQICRLGRLMALSQGLSPVRYTALVCQILSFLRRVVG